MMSKGSTPRPCDRKKFTENFDRIFRKKKEKSMLYNLMELKHAKQHEEEVQHKQNLDFEEKT